MEDVGIVIPAYRPDPDRLVTYLQALNEAFPASHLHVELDTPSRASQKALHDAPATVRIAPTRRGKGAAITAGFDALSSDILAFVDADGSTPPQSLQTVLDPVVEGDADLAVGSRRHPESIVPVHQSTVRRRLGDMFARVACTVLPIKLYDYQCGVKAMTAETWTDVRDELVSPGFAWDIELLTIAHAHDARIAEVPIVWEDKRGSTVGLGGTTSEFARALARSWHRSRCIRGARINREIDRLIGRPTPLIDSLSATDLDRSLEGQ